MLYSPLRSVVVDVKRTSYLTRSIHMLATQCCRTHHLDNSAPTVRHLPVREVGNRVLRAKPPQDIAMRPFEDVTDRFASADPHKPCLSRSRMSGQSSSKQTTFNLYTIHASPPESWIHHIMATKLRILVPVKRVIDYAVGFAATSPAPSSGELTTMPSRSSRELTRPRRASRPMSSTA